MRPASIFLIIQLSNSRGLYNNCPLILNYLILNFFALNKLFMYNPVFDSCWKKKSLYPLYLLGCRDFYRCFEL